MITVRENMRLAFERKEPHWIPFVSTDVSMAYVPAFGDAPRPNEKGELFDGYGVKWVGQENIGNMVDETVPPVIDDISNWREQLKLPDLSAFDWEKFAAEVNARWESEDKFRGIPFFNGMWERMYMLCGFEDALCYLITDPEETFALLSAIADFRVEQIKYISKYLKADKIHMHDDYGSDIRLMMSEETWRQLIKPNLKKIVDAAHEAGLFYEHHSCGYTAPLIPDLIELGVDVLQPVHIKNDPVSLKKKYGGQIAFMGGFDIQGVFDNWDSTYQDAYDEAMKTFEAMAPGGAYIVLHPSMIEGPNFAETDRGLRDALRDYNLKVYGKSGV